MPSPLISPPPSLLPDLPPEERTNTAALLLPHQALFAPPILDILRAHYESFGAIAHWAPIRAFGRVIIVWQEVEGCEWAKREGDFLKLDVDLPPVEDKDKDTDSAEPAQAQAQAQAGAVRSEGYFGSRRKPGQKGTILRLYALPFTPINPDPASFHLAPPETNKNFLISPPGSPPEGWEPVTEDAPNSVTLAEDLQRALESLALNGSKHRRRGSKEVILEEGGVRVEVEDTTMTMADAEDGGLADEAMGDEGYRDVEERLEGGMGLGAWEMPGQSRGGSAAGTPVGRMKMIPTAMPPR